MIVLFLIKQYDKLIIVLSMLQLKPNLDKEKDPMAGIMDLMKVRYCFSLVVCLGCRALYGIAIIIHMLCKNFSAFFDPILCM